MVLARFLPQNEQFFTLFQDAAANVNAAAGLLRDLLEHLSDVERLARHIRDLEHHGDEVTHAVFDSLNRTFVTPLDREDIRDLARALDDAIDAIEEVARRFWLFRVDTAPEQARVLGRIVAEQGALIERAVPLIQPGKGPGDLPRHIVELHRLEDEADDIAARAQGALFDGVTTVPGLVAAIRWGELYQGLEEATDRAEDVANTLEGILLKNA